VTPRDLVAEITERRARFAQRLHAVGAGRVTHLRKVLLESAPSSELLGYFPVAAIAALEASFRAVVKEAIDSSPDYLRRLEAAGLLREARPDWHLLAAIAGKQITVGELVSHLLPFSSVGHLERVVSAITDTPFNEALPKAARRAWDTGRASASDLIVLDAAQDAKLLARAFELRHDVAHEGTLPGGADAHQLAELLDAVGRMAEALYEMIDQHLFPEVALTQAAMTQRAAESAIDADQALDAAWLELAATLDEAGVNTLRTLQESFGQFRDARAALAGGAFEGGSMAPMIAASEFETATRECTSAVVRLAHLRGPDGGTEA